MTPAIVSEIGTLLIGLGILAALVALIVGALAIRAEVLARRLRKTVSTCRQASSDPNWYGFLHGRAEGTSSRAPFSGRPAVWWRVMVSRSGPGGEMSIDDEQSADTLTLTDDTGSIAVRGTALDPPPEQIRRWACRSDPLAGWDAASPHPLKHGAVPSTPFVATEFVVRKGQPITVLGTRKPDGTVGAPGRRSQPFFATRSPHSIAVNAHGGAVSMAKLAAGLAAVAVLLVGAGLLLH